MRQHFSRVKGFALVAVQRRCVGRRRRNPDTPYALHRGSSFSTSCVIDYFFLLSFLPPLLFWSTVGEPFSNIIPEALFSYLNLKSSVYLPAQPVVFCPEGGQAESPTDPKTGQAYFVKVMYI